MNTLVEAVERFEAALAASKVGFRAGSAMELRSHDRLKRTEDDLRQTLLRADTGDHDAVCEHTVVGCTEGVEHKGTIYAPGFDSDGNPSLILIRRVTPASRVDKIKPADWRAAG